VHGVPDSLPEVAEQFRTGLPQALLMTIRLGPDSRDADQSIVEQSVE
jgi:hypothetical protein